MRYLLDTNIIIPYLKDDRVTTALVDTLSADGIAVSILTYLEAFEGVIESPTPEEARAHFDAVFAGVPVVSVSPAVARQCAQIRSTLKRQGKSVRRRAFDLVIAATALVHGSELVTRNQGDFNDIPGLSLYQF